MAAAAACARSRIGSRSSAWMAAGPTRSRPTSCRSRTACSGSARRDTVGNTYRDTFRENDHMARGFVTAIATGTPASPDFRDGLAVQRVVDAAGLSNREGRRVTIAEIVARED